MEKHIMGENGISYTLGEDGLYYPDLYLPEETEYPETVSGEDTTEETEEPLTLYTELPEDS